MQFLYLFVSAFGAFIYSVSSINVTMPYPYQPRVIEGSHQTCPAAEARELVRYEIKADIRQLPIVRQLLYSDLYGHNCGGTSGWAQAAFLDMTNSSHVCPGDLREVIYNGLRLCARDSRSTVSGNPRICTSAVFVVNDAATPYSEVCGRVVGYQYGGTVGFEGYTFRASDNTIEDYYADGVTLTYGPVGSRKHIWTFVTARDEIGPETYGCPCNVDTDSRVTVPFFVGDSYFCEVGVASWTGYSFYSEPLWDGTGCTAVGNNCCTFNSPPYFIKRLPASSSDDIELRNCGEGRGVGNGYSYPSDTLVQLVEIYVK